MAAARLGGVYGGAEGAHRWSVHAGLGASLRGVADIVPDLAFLRDIHHLQTLCGLTSKERLQCVVDDRAQMNVDNLLAGGDGNVFRAGSSKRATSREPQWRMCCAFPP